MLLLVFLQQEDKWFEKKKGFIYYKQFNNE